MTVKTGKNNIHRKALDIRKDRVAYERRVARARDIRRCIISNVFPKITSTIISVDKFSYATNR